MKKIISILIVMFAFTLNVNAKTVTFSEVATKFKEPLDVAQDELDLGNAFVKAVEQYTTVTTTSSSIVANYKTDEMERIVTFNYSNGLITYNYVGSKTDSTAVSNSMIDSILISKLIYVICDLNGYTLDDIENFDDETKLSMEKNGMEIKTFKYENKTENLFESVEGYESLKIDLNKFNPKGNTISNLENNVNSNQAPNNSSSTNNINNNNTISNENTNKVENPKTGVEDTAVIALIFFLLGLIFIKLNKKDIIKKI